MFDRKVSGGAILHINVDAPFRTEEDSWNMVNLVAKMGVMYFLTLTLVKNEKNLNEA